MLQNSSLDWSNPALQRAAQRTRAANRMLGEEVGPRDDMREPGTLILRVNGYDYDLILQPHRRDVRLWNVLRDGEAWMPATGLERVWRRVQSEMAPCVGRRHWGG